MKRSTLTLNTRYVLTLTAVILLGLTGCASTSEEAEEPAADTGSEFSDAGATAPPPREPVEDTPAAAPMLAIDSVHFDFDKSEIRPDAVTVNSPIEVTLSLYRTDMVDRFIMGRTGFERPDGRSLKMVVDDVAEILKIF